MSRYERYGTRSLVYSHWHRFYMGDDEPMIDLDGIEYCSRKECREALVLVETALDVGQGFKATSVLERLSQQSGVMAICVLYRSTTPTPNEVCGCREGLVNPDCDHGIDRFRVRRVWPDPTPFGLMTPEQYRDRIREIRMAHLAMKHSTFIIPEAS